MPFYGYSVVSCPFYNPAPVLHGLWGESFLVPFCPLCLCDHGPVACLQAAVANAFDLLRSSEQTAPSKPKKKKNKSKSKAEGGDEAPAVVGESPVVGKAAIDTQPAVEVVELADAVPLLEKSARTQGPNRIKLWKDWLRQVRLNSQETAVLSLAYGAWIVVCLHAAVLTPTVLVCWHGCDVCPAHAAQGLCSEEGGFNAWCACMLAC